MAFVSCSQLAADKAALQAQIDDKQDALTNCAGAPLTGTVPTCGEMNKAIADGVSAAMATPTAAQAQAMATAIAADPTALATLLTAMSVFED